MIPRCRFRLEQEQSQRATKVRLGVAHGSTLRRPLAGLFEVPDRLFVLASLDVVVSKELGLGLGDGGKVARQHLSGPPVMCRLLGPRQRSVRSLLHERVLEYITRVAEIALGGAQDPPPSTASGHV